MATAEYTVGTLGAVMIAAVLYKLGLLDSDNPWMESFRDDPRTGARLGSCTTCSDLLPGLGIRAG